MHKLKGFIFRFQKQIFITTEVVAAALGAYFAYVTVDRYAIVVRATLGLVVLFLLSREYLLSKKIVEKSVGIQIEYPKDLKYLVVDFFAVIVMIWAGAQILHLIWYFINILPRG